MLSLALHLLLFALVDVASADTCEDGTDPYTVELIDSYGDGWEDLQLDAISSSGDKSVITLNNNTESEFGRNFTICNLIAIKLSEPKDQGKHAFAYYDESESGIKVRQNGEELFYAAPDTFSKTSDNKLLPVGTVLWAHCQDETGWTDTGSCGTCTGRQKLENGVCNDIPACVFIDEQSQCHTCDEGDDMYNLTMYDRLYNSDGTSEDSDGMGWFNAMLRVYTDDEDSVPYRNYKLFWSETGVGSGNKTARICKFKALQVVYLPTPTRENRISFTISGPNDLLVEWKPSNISDIDKGGTYVYAPPCPAGDGFRDMSSGCGPCDANQIIVNNICTDCSFGEHSINNECVCSGDKYILRLNNDRNRYGGWRDLTILATASTDTREFEWEGSYGPEDYSICNLQRLQIGQPGDDDDRDDSSYKLFKQINSTHNELVQERAVSQTDGGWTDFPSGTALFVPRGMCPEGKKLDGSECQWECPLICPMDSLALKVAYKQLECPN